VAGRHRHPDGRTGSTRESNVVQLRPRQWLDAEEELVPIDGTSTESRDERTASSPRPASPAENVDGGPSAPDERGHASTWLGAGEETVPIGREPAREATESNSGTWAASDFWGEDAALVQDALEVPATASSPSEAVAPPQHPEAPRRSVRAPALAAIAIAAAAILAAAINGFGSAPAAPRSAGSVSSLHASTSASSDADTDPVAGTAERLRTTAAAREHRISNRTRERSRQRSMASRRTARRTQRRTKPATTAVVDRYVAPVSTPAPTIDRSVTPPEDTNAGSSSRAGPTGIGALIGPGTTSSG
jgi:hypothetical protein